MKTFELDFVSFATIGVFNDTYYPEEKREFKWYSCLLSKLYLEQSMLGQFDFVCEIDRLLLKEHKEGNYDEEDILSAKKQLLTDDKYLNGRIEILEYLIKEKRQDLPHLINIIQNRQCGILR